MLVYRFAINCINAVPKTGNQGRCRRGGCVCVHACVPRPGCLLQRGSDGDSRTAMGGSCWKRGDELVSAAS